MERRFASAAQVCRAVAVLGGSSLLLLAPAAAEFLLLEPSAYHENFVEGWPGPYLNGTGAGEVNESTYQWATSNLPLFEVSDPDVQATYYYRAKAYKTHLMRTEWADIQHVVSEQCTGFGDGSATSPDGFTCWGGAYGTINAAAGHHITEGRWLRDPRFMDGLIRFWVGAIAHDKLAATHGHLANGTQLGGATITSYSNWILTAALRRAQVKGDLTLGEMLDGTPVTLEELLPSMVQYWEQGTLNRRVDCLVANAGARGACLDTPPRRTPSQRRSGDPATLPEQAEPYCYMISDGYDAMEGSISGGGCRPTIGAMFWSDARAIATVARLVGNTSLASQFEQRAAWIREWYLEHLWSDEAQFLGVYKQGVALTGRAGGGCTTATMRGEDDPSCCCIKEMPSPPGRYENFSVCAGPPPVLPVAPQNRTACTAARQFTKPGSSPPTTSSLWQCGAAAPVRELLGLGPAYYFGMMPTANDGQATKYDGMWSALFDAKAGFWGKFGPTTVERRSVCFNVSQDSAECNWAGPSWPYETSRVLTGLANFLSDYPAAQAAAAGMTPAHFTKLLRTYAYSHTHGNASNGSVPWLGENIDADTGNWIAHNIAYKGGSVNLDGSSAAGMFNCSKCAAARASCTATSGPKANCGGLERTCGGRQYVPPCCGETPSCDGTILPNIDKDRGKDYMHSSFIDIVISGLVGIRGTVASSGASGASVFGEVLDLAPLADASIDYFALDNVYFRGKNVTIAYDKAATRYAKRGCAKGVDALCVWVDGVLKATSKSLARLNVSLAA